MSNLKKYLKVYKEDTQRTNAFKQYMQIVSENQDFFTTHEVNEFFIDMIKEGTIVYDEGAKDYLKKLGKGLVIGSISLLPFLPSSLNAIDITFKNNVTVTAERLEKVKQELQVKMEEIDNNFEEVNLSQRENIKKLKKDNNYQENLTKSFTEIDFAKIEYYFNLSNLFKTKGISKLNVDSDHKKNILESIEDLKENTMRNRRFYEELLKNENDKNKIENFKYQISTIDTEITKLKNLYDTFNDMLNVK